MKTVILAAGFGSRLWPISTSENPKQFQPLINGESLLVYTYRQLATVTPVDELYVLTLEGLEKHVRAQLPDIADDHIILVPERRNTLPHTVWALHALGGTPDEPVLFKSVDHYMRDADAFLASLSASTARYDRTKPAVTLLCTEYTSFDHNNGYLLADDSRRIVEYLEKPTEDMLEALRSKGSIYCSPFVYIACQSALEAALGKLDNEWSRAATKLVRAPESEFKQLFLGLPFIDISSTLFHDSKDLMMDTIKYDFVDVGKYDALYALNAKDVRGNVIMGEVVLSDDCQNNFICNRMPEPLAVVGCSDSVIVQTPHGSLVSSMKNANDIGELYKTRILKK